MEGIVEMRKTKMEDGRSPRRGRDEAIGGGGGGGSCESELGIETENAKGKKVTK